jgi:hypothetical protein
VVGVAVAVAGLALVVGTRREVAPERGSRELVVAGAQLLGLCALAVAEPLFDLLSDNRRISECCFRRGCPAPQSFAIMVPDRLLHEGRNDVRAFALN